MTERFADFHARIFSDPSLMAFGTNENGEPICYGVSIEKLNARLDDAVTRSLLAMAAEEKRFLRDCLPDLLEEFPFLEEADRQTFIDTVELSVSCIPAHSQPLKIARKFLRDGIVEELEVETLDGGKVAHFCWTEIGAEALYLVHSGQA